MPIPVNRNRVGYSNPGNFPAEELVRSQTATRLGLDNEPDMLQWHALESCAWNVLQPARDQLGAIYVTSGYRSPEVNASIGGAAASDHQSIPSGQVCAVDLVHADLFRLFRHLSMSGYSIHRLIWEFGEWVHLSYVPSCSRMKPLGLILEALRVDGKTKYRPTTVEEIGDRYA